MFRNVFYNKRNTNFKYLFGDIELFIQYFIYLFLYKSGYYNYFNKFIILRHNLVCSFVCVNIKGNT